jgi:hypothetical protein
MTDARTVREGHASVLAPRRRSFPITLLLVNENSVRVSDPDALADTLQRTIADLDGHINRGAQELAAPLIDAARADADRAVTAAQRETERQTDLVKELRRQYTALENQLDNLRIKHGERRDFHVAQRRPAVDTGPLGGTR